MKKILSVLVALVMLFTCAVSAMAETAENVDEKKAEEMAAVTEWLAAQVTEEEAAEILSWDKETILAKLEAYDQPLESTTKEEIADEMAQVIGLFGMFAGMMQGNENGEESLDLSGLLGGLLGSKNGENGEESFDLSVLLGGLMGGESGENGEESFDLSALFGALSMDAEEGYAESGEDQDGEEFSYEIVDLFNGTFWQFGDLKLESVFQDGYYKVVITEGERELSYLCEYDELEENDNYYARLTGIGTGVEEFDEEQEDHGIATFTMNDDGNLVWKKADGSEVVFTEVVDPLTTKEWYVDGKLLHISWLGELDYSVQIDDWKEGNVWTYQCTLDEDTDVMTGTGFKTQYGEEVYTDANATLAFTNARILLTWKDDKEETTADGVTFEMVEDAFTMNYWEAEGVEDYTGYFADGNYILSLTLNGTRYAYVCTYDRDQGKLTAVDPATLDPEEYSDPEKYRSTATFELLEDNTMRWVDDSGITGADGIVLTCAQ